MKLKKRLTQKGQALLEVILVMSVVIATWVGVSKVLKDDGFFQKVFGDPWARLSTTIEFGIPMGGNGGTNNLKSAHPATIERHSTRLAKVTP